jgi:signal transduction histidine kinase
LVTRQAITPVKQMKSLLSLLFLAVALLAMSSAYAEERATLDEAKAMAIKAAEYLQAVGPEKAFPEFDAKNNATWHDRELYVIVQDDTGMMVAHGTNPGMIGKSMLDLKDVDGKPFNRETQAIKDAGWVEFKWKNPVTSAVEPKKQYIIRVGHYLVGVGAYAQ